MAAYMNNGECLSAILFHRLCEAFWDLDFTIFIQAKFGFHIFQLANGNFMTNVLGRIFMVVKGSIHSCWTS